MSWDRTRPQCGLPRELLKGVTTSNAPDNSLLALQLSSLIALVIPIHAPLRNERKIMLERRGTANTSTEKCPRVLHKTDEEKVSDSFRSGHHLGPRRLQLLLLGLLKNAFVIKNTFCSNQTSSSRRRPRAIPDQNGPNPWRYPPLGIGISKTTFHAKTYSTAKESNKSRVVEKGVPPYMASHLQTPGTPPLS